MQKRMYWYFTMSINELSSLIGSGLNRRWNAIDTDLSHATNFTRRFYYINVVYKQYIHSTECEYMISGKSK